MILINFTTAKTLVDEQKVKGRKPEMFGRHSNINDTSIKKLVSLL